MTCLPVLEDLTSICKHFFSFTIIFANQNEVMGIAIENFAGCRTDFREFTVIFRDNIACFGDLCSDSVELLEIRNFFLKFSPKLFV